MSLEKLLADPPKLHAFFPSKATPEGVLKAGELTNRWKLSDEELRFIHDHVAPGDRTIETGAGCSTLVFLLRGCHHTAIAPDSCLRDRIVAYRDKHNLPGSLRYLCEASEQALPSIKQMVKLALIDGRHGFPQPFIDYYYIGKMVELGGYLVVDDLHVWTCETMCRYLMESGCWTLVHESLGGMAFRKENDTDQDANYEDQPFVSQRSRQFSVKAKVRYLAWRRKMVIKAATLYAKSILAGTPGQRPNGRR